MPRKNKVLKIVKLPLVEVAAGIILRDNEFLATQRPKDKPMEGFWEFPGGKIRAGEKPEDALCRELGEELGIVPQDAELVAIRDHAYAEYGFEARLYFFVVTQWLNVPGGREGQGLAWLEPTQAKENDFLPADRDLLRWLGEYIAGGKMAGQ